MGLRSLEDTQACAKALGITLNHLYRLERDERNISKSIERLTQLYSELGGIYTTLS